jgi:hypothetical protein
MHFHPDAGISLLEEIGNSFGREKTRPRVPDDLSLFPGFGESCILRRRYSPGGQ